MKGKNPPILDTVSGEPDRDSGYFALTLTFKPGTIKPLTIWVEEDGAVQLGQWANEAAAFTGDPANYTEPE